MFLLHLFVYFSRVNFFFSYPWCQGLAAACDYGTSWAFLLTFLFEAKAVQS